MNNVEITNKKTKKGFIVLIVIIVLSIIIPTISILSAKTSNTGFTTLWAKMTTGKYIAVLKIEGTISVKSDGYDQKWLLDTIDKLIDDNSNQGIILDINSPGGTVYEADQAYLALMDYKHKTGRPIIAYFEQLAASGGYYIGCSADYIWANRNTLTGSIGVIAGQSYDLSKLFEKYGITYNLFTAGKNKGMLGIASPVTEEQRNIMEVIANECYLQFCTIVSNSRHITLKKVKAIADGRIYTAHQAQVNGLIDYIGSLDDVDNWTKKLIGDTEKNIKYVWYEPKEDSNILKSFLHSASTALSLINTQTNLESEVQTLVTTIKKMTGVPDNLSYPAYYWNH
jgi:protease-4